MVEDSACTPSDIEIGQPFCGRDRVRDVLAALLQRLGQAADRVRALLGAPAREGALVEGLARRADGAVHVGRRRIRHAADHLLGVGGDDVDAALGVRVHQLATDEDLTAFLHGLSFVVAGRV